MIIILATIASFYSIQLFLGRCVYNGAGAWVDTGTINMHVCTYTCHTYTPGYIIIIIMHHTNLSSVSYTSLVLQEATIERVNKKIILMIAH